MLLPNLQFSTLFTLYYGTFLQVDLNVLYTKIQYVSMVGDI
jgi:hypothetical protein